MNLVAWIEGIRIPDLDQPVSQSDLAALLGMLYMPSDVNKPEAIRTDCDVLRILAKYVPEVAKLTASAKEGQIPLSDLGEVVSPFVTGKTPIPDTKPSAER